MGIDEHTSVHTHMYADKCGKRERKTHTEMGARQMENEEKRDNEKWFQSRRNCVRLSFKCQSNEKSV